MFDPVLWWALLATASAIVLLLIVQGERGEKREILKNRAELCQHLSSTQRVNKWQAAKIVRLESTLTRVLLNDENNRMVADAESIPVSFEERAG